MGKVRGGFRLQVEDADDLILDDERDGEFGSDIRVRVDVVVLVRDIVDEKRLALECSLTGDTAAQLDTHALDFRGVADLEAHAEVSSALVDEEDGKDLVVDHGADEVRDPVHEGVEVEGGVEGVGEAVEEVDLEGFDANFRVCSVGVEELGCGGAVVAFEVMFGLGRLRVRWWRGARFGRGRHSALR